MIQKLYKFITAKTIKNKILTTSFLLFALLSCGSNTDASEQGNSISCDSKKQNSCQDKEFCRLEKGLCLNAAKEQLGICITKPDICIEIYAPVCGCDGKTYSNECHAYGVGVSIQKDGRCEDKDVINN